MFLIEEIADDIGTFVQIFDAKLFTDTKFITPDNFNFQVGFAADKLGRNYIPHVHTNIERTVQGTAEFIFILDGRMDVIFLDGVGQPVQEASLTTQMGFLQTRGGHAISTHPGTRFFEVKQGPYAGRDADKFAVSLPARSSFI